jgi:hypothetical protein
MAHWYERRLTQRTEAMPLIFAKQLGLGGDKPGRKPRGSGAPRRRLAPRYAGDKGAE